jgi:hypothetical protein
LKSGIGDAFLHSPLRQSDAEIGFARDVSCEIIGETESQRIFFIFFSSTLAENLGRTSCVHLRFTDVFLTASCQRRFNAMCIRSMRAAIVYKFRLRTRLKGKQGTQMSMRINRLNFVIVVPTGSGAPAS